MAEDIAVAMIEYIGGHGGMDYYDFGLCRGLLDAGCRVSLYTCDETAEPAMPGLHFFPLYRKVFGSGSRWIRALRYLRGSLHALAKAVLRGEKICHLHLFTGEFEGMALVMLAKLVARKVVVTVHDVESFSPEAARQSTAARVYFFADRLVVHNEISKRELVDNLRIPPEKIQIIPSGNYLADVSGSPDRTHARAVLGLPQSGKTILFFGQIKDAKGLDILIQAIPEVARRMPTITLLIAGRPWKTDFSPYQLLIDRLGVNDRCVLHIRYIPNDELSNYFAAADVVVLPYRKIYQSGVILLAMSYERAVVVSDIPGMTEMVTDGQNGYVFTQGSKDSLAEQLIKVLRDDEGRARLAARALEYVRDNHNWEEIGRRTAELYRDVLSS